MSAQFKNEPEALARDPRKLPPWHLTGVVLCRRFKTVKGFFGGTERYARGTIIRERWDNTVTGEVEMRATSFMDVIDDWDDQ